LEATRLPDTPGLACHCHGEHVRRAFRKQA
jgi:hypothetical protein